MRARRSRAQSAATAPGSAAATKNTNGLPRRYLPKGADPADHTQDELDAIALSLNTRPRERLDAGTPLECHTDLIQLDQMPIGIMQ